MTKPKIIAREFTAAEPTVPPTEIWCVSSPDGSVLVRARNVGIGGDVFWSLLWIDGDGVHFAKCIPLTLGLPLDADGRLKVAR